MYRDMVTLMGEVSRQQKMLKRHLPRVVYHRVYSSVRRTSGKDVPRSQPGGTRIQGPLLNQNCFCRFSVRGNGQVTPGKSSEWNGAPSRVGSSSVPSNSWIPGGLDLRTTALQKCAVIQGRARLKDNCSTEMCSRCRAGSYLRL